MLAQLSVIVILFSCTTWQVHGAVNCTSAGRYADPADATCKRYTLCVFISVNNSFISYDYTCPTTSVFSPVSRQCTTSYVCNNTNSTTPTNSTGFTCTTNGFFANPNAVDCSTYIQCVSINGTFDQSILTCPNNTFYNPNTTLCDFNYNCTQTPTATCTSAGRIPDTTDTTCQRYFLCIATTNGTLLQYNYTCPSTSVFSPTARLCTTNYTCPT
ncbi:unnamed protein product [Leptosia nina]|uniref:Chitin-binding type-2 domain-containing protein n=1 Tax=Leptosia nina TaxID=320188 RepID=A0AAV1JST6_9NEOP